jgi:hypothetical protein
MYHHLGFVFWLHKMGSLGSEKFGRLGRIVSIAHIDLLVYTVYILF